MISFVGHRTSNIIAASDAVVHIRRLKEHVHWTGEVFGPFRRHSMGFGGLVAAADGSCVAQLHHQLPAYEDG